MAGIDQHLFISLPRVYEVVNAFEGHLYQRVDVRFGDGRSQKGM